MQKRREGKNSTSGEECHLSEFSIGQHQIKGCFWSRARSASWGESSSACPRLFCPTCSLQVNIAMCARISFRATVGLQIALTPSRMLSVSPPTCTQSPPSFTPLQRKAPHNSDSVDLEKLIQVCSIFSLCQVCNMWTEQGQKLRAD